MDKVAPDKAQKDLLDVVDLLCRSVSRMDYAVSIIALLDEEISTRNADNPHTAYALTEALALFAENTKEDLLDCEKLLTTLNGGKKIV